MSAPNGRNAKTIVSNEDATAIVSRSGWLAKRPAAFREEVIAHSRLATFKKGEAIYRIGDPPTGPYGLVKGLLRIEAVVGNNGGQIAFIGRPGFWIGVAAAMHRHERKLSLISGSDTLLFYLPLHAFEQLAADAENLRHFASLLNENNDIAMTMARDLMNPDVHARIASRLLAIFGPGDDGIGSEIAITQADLASLCNVSRKTINQELARLEKAGAISLGYGRLSLLDPSKLEAAAKGGPENFAALAENEPPKTATFVSS